MRSIVDVQDLQPDRASSYTVASYVRAVLKVRALRRELAHTLLEVERRKQALNRRHQAGVLLAEAHRVLEEFGTEADINDDHTIP